MYDKYAQVLSKQNDLKLTLTPKSYTQSKLNAHLRSRLRIEVRPTENDSTRLYKNGDISVVITCS